MLVSVQECGSAPQWIEVNDLVISLIVPDWLKVFHSNACMAGYSLKREIGEGRI